jgi:hypothetical protein
MGERYPVTMRRSLRSKPVQGIGDGFGVWGFRPACTKSLGSKHNAASRAWGRRWETVSGSRVWGRGLIVLVLIKLV